MLKIFLLAQIYAIRSQQTIDINALTQDIACFKCEPDSALDGFEVSILQRTAGNLGATWEDLAVGDMTAAQLRDAIKCYKCVEPKLLRAAYVYALCWVLENLTAPT